MHPVTGKVGFGVRVPDQYDRSRLGRKGRWGNREEETQHRRDPEAHYVFRAFTVPVVSSAIGPRDHGPSLALDKLGFG